jgi:GNAT superfamily N-acetyltransferase
MIRVKDISLIEQIFEEQKGKKIITNSFYFLEQFVDVINENRLFFIQNNSNFILLEFKPQINSYELFYFIEDLSNYSDFNSELPVVMEIPYRGSDHFPENIVDFWCNSGFKKHINRDLYFLNFKGSEAILNDNIQIKLVDDLKESSKIYDLIVQTFDELTGDIQSEVEIRKNIQHKQILGAFMNNHLVGFVRFYNKGKVSWIGHIATTPDSLGKGVGKSMVSAYLNYQYESGFVNFQHWVVSDNIAALKLYNQFGFQKMNKSSMSLIKK